MHSPIRIFFLIVFSLSIVKAENQANKKYIEAASRNEGNAENGKKIFYDKRSLCSECHSINGKANSIGPDLAAAGDKFSRSDIIQSIIHPSASIMTGYATTIIETTNQESFIGILKSINDDNVILSNLDEKKRTIPKSIIKSQITSPASLMPVGLHTKLNTKEFTDLTAFLESLKLPQRINETNHATPIAIKRVEKPITLEPFFGTELDFEKPVWFGDHPVIKGTYVIVEKSRALVSLLTKNNSGQETKSRFLEIPEEVYVTNDEGLLGFTFHPQFKENRRYFFMHEVKHDNYRGMVIGERIASEDFSKDSGKPTKKVLEFEVATEFHHGGGIEFGPDGYLYIGMGDGGPQEDPLGNAQNLHSFAGKLLRIDVDKNTNNKFYSIPKDNPFIGHPDEKVLREIFSYGLRQPWRFSFDSKTGDLWVGDVGQNRFEEINIVRSGENHGWNVFEGYELFSTKFRKENLNLINPVISFRRSHGVSITGGYVIRSKGVNNESYEGVYICADYQSKKIWGIKQKNRTLEMVREIGNCPDRLVSFGIDKERNIYAIGYDKGIIYKLDFSGSIFE
ncbi:MAG: PQQ-dependent sugar dehydrogenase [Verrucomicrobiota bacterium]|nr:PQQ-dependent sugar dehydrogenase [Verrucomicrobiota bacterium]|tara:strand:+ start:6292 stop:7989 length:1698 start_codon:yes stop_codon:yes gene_type:complete